MTYDQTKFYLLHPRIWLRWKLQQAEAWRLKRKARKSVRRFMAEVREMEANLREAADPCCPKCYGQGQKGWNLTTKQWATCQCTYNPRTAEKCEEKPWLRP